ncbi:MAG TPA: flavoprotein [Thermoanaerobaculia bacterium]|nr:flavoprotein [Thermoanaerobaculia bacterium]
MPGSSPLGALATGSARTLVHRAGAVALKERWPLVLGFRETPTAWSTSRTCAG